jgi:hypothetical protein
MPAARLAKDAVAGRIHTAITWEPRLVMREVFVQLPGDGVATLVAVTHDIPARRPVWAGRQGWYTWMPGTLRPRFLDNLIHTVPYILINRDAVWLGDTRQKVTILPGCESYPKGADDEPDEQVRVQVRVRVRVRVLALVRAVVVLVVVVVVAAVLFWVIWGLAGSGVVGQALGVVAIVVGVAGWGVAGLAWVWGRRGLAVAIRGLLARQGG